MIANGASKAEQAVHYIIALPFLLYKIQKTNNDSISIALNCKCRRHVRKARIKYETHRIIYRLGTPR